MNEGALVVDEETRMDRVSMEIIYKQERYAIVGAGRTHW